jgi:hypothetical protein
LGWTIQPLTIGVLEVALHTLAMLVVATVIAVTVYETWASESCAERG